MLAETLRTKDIEAVYLEEPHRDIQPGEVVLRYRNFPKGFKCSNDHSGLPPDV